MSKFNEYLEAVRSDKSSHQVRGWVYEKDGDIYYKHRPDQSVAGFKISNGPRLPFSHSAILS